MPWQEGVYSTAKTVVDRRYIEKCGVRMIRILCLDSVLCFMNLMFVSIWLMNIATAFPETF